MLTPDRPRAATMPAAARPAAGRSATELATARPPLEWRVAPPAPDGLLFGEGLVAIVAEALKCFHLSPRLAACPLVRLASAARCRSDGRIADDPLGRAFALRALLARALGRLADADREGAALLEARFVRQKPIAHFELEGQARATVLRRSRRALEELTWELWTLEQEALREGYAPDVRDAAA